MLADFFSKHCQLRIATLSNHSCCISPAVTPQPLLPVVSVTSAFFCCRRCCCSDSCSVNDSSALRSPLPLISLQHCSCATTYYSTSPQRFHSELVTLFPFVPTAPQPTTRSKRCREGTETIAPPHDLLTSLHDPMVPSFWLILAGAPY